MNRHFRDARYYGRPTAEHLYRGLRAELRPVERRRRGATGREPREPTRAGRWRARLRATESTAERRARRAVRRVRERV
ncbi:DUF7553 family protein [Halorussus marinus]